MIVYVVIPKLIDDPLYFTDSEYQEYQTMEAFSMYENMFYGYSLSRIIAMNYKRYLECILGKMITVNLYEYSFNREIPTSKIDNMPDDSILQELVEKEYFNDIDDKKYPSEICKIDVFENELKHTVYMTTQIQEYIGSVFYNEYDIIESILPIFSKEFRLIRDIESDPRIIKLKTILLDSLTELMSDFYSQTSRLKMDPLEITQYYISTKKFMK